MPYDVVTSYGKLMEIVGMEGRGLGAILRQSEVTTFLTQGDIDSVFQKMCRKGVAESMAIDPFYYSGFIHRNFTTFCGPDSMTRCRRVMSLLKQASISDQP